MKNHLLTSLPLLVLALDHPAQADTWGTLKENISKKFNDVVEGEVSPAKTDKSAAGKWAAKEMEELSRLVDLYKGSRNAEIRQQAEEMTEAIIKKYRKVYTFLGSTKKNAPANDSKKKVSLSSLEPFHARQQDDRMALYKKYLEVNGNFIKNSRGNLAKIQPIGCILRTHLFEDFPQDGASRVSLDQAAEKWVNKENEDMKTLLGLLPECEDKAVLAETISLMEQMIDSYAPLYKEIQKLTPYRKYEKTKKIFNIEIELDNLRQAHSAAEQKRAAHYVTFLGARNIFNRYAPAYSDYLKTIEIILTTHREKKAAADRGRFTSKRAMHFGR